MEKVLCLHRKDIPEKWLNEMGANALSAGEFFKCLKYADICWIDRKDAENDFSFKQIIPYAVFRKKNENKVACYQRSGSEKRLDDLWSVGIGGHINPVDATGDAWTLRHLVEQGLFREIEEETGKRASDVEADFIGVINEEKTEVGKVHFGLVWRVCLKSSDGLNPSEELSRFRWLKMETVKKMKLEYWSRLAVDLMAS